MLFYPERTQFRRNFYLLGIARFKKKLYKTVNKLFTVLFRIDTLFRCQTGYLLPNRFFKLLTLIAAYALRGAYVRRRRRHAACRCTILIFNKLRLFQDFQMNNKIDITVGKL